jgi:hypothetical protein
VLTAYHTRRKARRIIKRASRDFPFSRLSAYNHTDTSWELNPQQRLDGAYWALTALSKLKLTPNQADALLHHATKKLPGPKALYTMYLYLADRHTANASLGQATTEPRPLLDLMESSMQALGQDQACLLSTEFAEYTLAWIGYYGQERFGDVRVTNPTNLCDQPTYDWIASKAGRLPLMSLYQPADQEINALGRHVSASLSPHVINSLCPSAEDVFWAIGFTNLTRVNIDCLLASYVSNWLPSDSIAYLAGWRPDFTEQLVDYLIATKQTCDFTPIVNLIATQEDLYGPLTSSQLIRYLQILSPHSTFNFLLGHWSFRPPPSLAILHDTIDMLRQHYPRFFADSEVFEELVQDPFLSETITGIDSPLSTEYLNTMLDITPGLAWAISDIYPGSPFIAPTSLLAHGAGHVRSRLNALPGPRHLTNDLFNDWRRPTLYPISLDEFCAVTAAHYRLHGALTKVSLLDF